MSNLGLAIFTTSLEFVFNDLHPSKISSVFITLKNICSFPWIYYSIFIKYYYYKQETDLEE